MACQLGGFLEHDLALSSSQTQLLFARHRVCNKSLFDGLTIRSSVRMLQTDLKVASERSTSPSDLHVDRSAQGFLTFTVGKTQFRGLCLLPLSRALSELSKYEIKKGGHFILRQSL